MPPDQDDDTAPELPWVERRPIARLAAFGDKTEKPVITAKALREQKAAMVRVSGSSMTPACSRCASRSGRSSTSLRAEERVRREQGVPESTRGEARGARPREGS